MLCVVRMTARPSRLPLTTSHSWRRLAGSRPVLGSSRYTTLGWPMKLIATLRRRFMPPENAADGLSAASVSRTPCSASATAASSDAPDRPLRRPKKQRCSRAVRLSQSRLS
eukprot:321489-Chlamydomonas_euryale.AAC.1